MKTTKKRIRIIPWFLMGLILLTVTGCPEEDDPEEDPIVPLPAWEKSYTPVLSGTPGSWDESSLLQASVLLVDNVYHMWYGGSKSNYLGTSFSIGHATSADGLTWTKDPSNPVLVKGPEGSWEGHMVYMPLVIKVGDTFHMWYTGRNAQTEQIGYAISTDGVAWTKSEFNPVLTTGTAGSWDVAHVGTGPVMYRDNKFHMWYIGSTDGDAFKVGYATSVDGANWTRHPGNPVMENGGVGSWDYPRVQAGSVIHNGTGYEMWYGGGKFGSWRIGHATSPDGITWKRDANPCLRFGNGITGWDIAYVGWPTVLQGPGTKLRMWYSSTTNTVLQGGAIGYAEKQ